MPVVKYVENITKKILDTSSKIELIFVTKLIIKHIYITVILLNSKIALESLNYALHM
jgi:hypothetical protein